MRRLSGLDLAKILSVGDRLVAFETQGDRSAVWRGLATKAFLDL